jgi:signal recognition particle subunit SRP54
VAELLKRFVFMQKMMSQIGEQASLLQKIPGMKQMAMARKLKDAVKTGGLDNNPMLANLADGLLEAAVAGEGEAGAGPRTSKSRAISKNKRKSLRKMQKKARKKSRK